MTGTVEHMSLREARKQTYSDQARLSSFNGNGDTTYVGIVRSDNDDLTDVVDEQITALAPPEELFYQWLNTRKKLENDSAVNYVQAHNQALDRVNYRSRYRSYLDEDDEAQTALDELVSRVRDGEHIVLVCYCGDGKWCHRQVVHERIQERLTEVTQ